MSGGAETGVAGSRKGALRFRRYAEVALPVPLYRTFTYGVPDSLDAVQPGSRVRVRFGVRVLIGCVTRLDRQRPELPPKAKLQPLLAVLDDEPVLGRNLLALGEWMADYYVAPPGEILHAMLPPETPRAVTERYRRTPGGQAALEGCTLKKGTLRLRVLEALERPMTARELSRTLRSSRTAGALRFLVERGYAHREERRAGRGAYGMPVASITEAGRRALEEQGLRPTPTRVLTLLATATEAVPLRTIRSELSLKVGPFRSLSRRGYIRISRQAALQSPWGRLEPARDAVVSLSEGQQEIVARIQKAIASREFLPLVIHGITGSGKTEIYLRAAEAALAAGRSALLLVPEIALTPRLAGLLRSRFASQVAILHSALGSGERREEWWRVRRGEARVIVGARAAILVPSERIGLVVVDEEHDSSYKQDERPRYNARDLAVKRAREEGGVVVLGSATPSLESYKHAMDGRYQLASLPERVGGRSLARVQFIDMKEVVREEGPETILSRPLREALAERFSAGEQAIVLLNRRGYATQLLCRECGLAATCSECSVALTLHRKGRLAVCHYCGLGRPTPERCDLCHGEYLHHRGYGTEKVEELLRETFPAVRVARMDRDTMRRKGSYEALLSWFARRKLDLLVGTQMLAKGHDFPAVTLVGVLGADAALGVPDFRAAERTFQLLTQVAGRAGRGERPGEVLIQAFTPDHYALRHARAQDYEGFYEEELRFRRSLRYPPALSLINVVFEGEEMHGATRLARRVAATLNRSRPEGVEILGPAFAVRSKVAGRYRCQVLVKLSRQHHRSVRGTLRALMEEPELARHMSIDVDPTVLS